MICLNSKGLPMLEELQYLRAVTEESMIMDDKMEEMRLYHLDGIRLMKEMCSEFNPEALFADGFDESILGVDTKGRVTYSYNKIIETLMERDGMTEEEAREFFSFNIDGAYVGEYTPIYIYEE